MRPAGATAESYDTTLMPRSSAFLSVGTNASGSFAETAMASTRCAISALSTSICPSAVGVVGPVKMTSASSSLAASSAPLWTASKNPLPSDLATRPMRVRPGFPGSLLPQPATAANTAHAAATTNLFTYSPTRSRLRDLLHLIFGCDLGDDDLDARGAEVFEFFGPRAVVGDDGVDAVETGHDH